MYMKYPMSIRKLVGLNIRDPEPVTERYILPLNPIMYIWAWKHLMIPQ